MNNSESSSGQHSGNELDDKIAPPVDAEITRVEAAETAEKPADRLPRWGVGTAKQRLLSFGMVLAYALIFFLLFRIVGLLMIGARSLPPPIRSTLGEVLAALCAIGAT